MYKNQFTIHDLEKNDRPRERLIQLGAPSLADHELLAILLRTGTKDTSVLGLSHRLLKQFEDLHLLKDATIEELTKTKGIGEAKAIQLLAAFELGKRVQNLKFQDRFTIEHPSDCAAYVMDDMRFLSQEHFVCVYLNTKNQVISKQTIFVGGLSTAFVHPREIFKEALRRSAATLICLHNHPSGDPTPSEEDIQITKRLVQVGKMIGIELLDHIIIGDNKYLSLKEKGHI